MIIGPWRRRRPALLAAGLLGAVVLAGCGSEVEGEASASTTSAPASSSSAASSSSGAPAGSSSAGASTGALDDVANLSAGLLPAEAFGAGAVVTPITADQVEQQQSQLGGLGGLGGPQDVTITPETCTPAVQSVQPGLEDLTGLGAQTVTVGTSATAEILAAGNGITAGVDQLAATVQSCPEATITAPAIGTATVTFAELDVPEVGDASSGVTMTISLIGPDGQPIAVPLLIAMVADGDRLLSLTATDPTGAADPVAFAALVQQAYDHQADALD